MYTFPAQEASNFDIRGATPYVYAARISHLSYEKLRTIL